MEKTRAGIQSVEVGFGLLDVLARATSPLMLRDLALAACMSAAKAHRYLVSFQRLRLVMQDANTTLYDFGPAALALGLASLSRIDAVKLARGRIVGLMLEIGHTLALAVWGKHGPTIVHWEESPLVVTVNPCLSDLALGSTATFDARWDGTVAQALCEAARRLSSDLGHSPPPSAMDAP